MLSISSGKATKSIISGEENGLKIVIPKKRNWITLLLFFGLFFYLIMKIVKMSNHLIVLVGLFFLVIIAYLILLSAGGTEEIVINNKNLIKKRKLFGINFLFGQRFDLNDIHHLQFAPKFFGPLPEHIGIQYGESGKPYPYDPSTLLESFGIGRAGSIYFDYGFRIIRFGAGLEDDELKYLVELIKGRFPVLKS